MARPSRMAKAARLTNSISRRLRRKKARGPAARGTIRSPSKIIGCLLSQLPQLTHVHGVERLTDTEDENAEDQHSDQNIKKDANLNHQWHSIGQRNRGQEEAVFKRKQSQDLRQCLAAVYHHKEADQEKCDGNGERVMSKRRPGRSLFRMVERLRDHVAQQSQTA